MSGSGTGPEAISGRKNPIRPARRDSSSATPSTTADLPLPASIAVMYTPGVMASACQQLVPEQLQIRVAEALIGQPAVHPAVPAVDQFQEPLHPARPRRVLLVGNSVHTFGVGGRGAQPGEDGVDPLGGRGIVG